LELHHTSTAVTLMRLQPGTLPQSSLHLQRKSARLLMRLKSTLSSLRRSGFLLWHTKQAQAALALAMRMTYAWRRIEIHE
jgi:hypothetical protein